MTDAPRNLHGLGKRQRIVLRRLLKRKAWTRLYGRAGGKPARRVAFSRAITTLERRGLIRIDRDSPRTKFGLVPAAVRESVAEYLQKASRKTQQLTTAGAPAKDQIDE